MPLSRKKNATSLGFKEGDRFRVVIENSFDLGDIVTLIKDDGTDQPKFQNDTGDDSYEYFTNLEPLVKTLDTLIVGDVIVGKERLPRPTSMYLTLSYRDAADHYEYQVLAVLAPGVYLLSVESSFNVAGSIYTAHEIKENNFTIKGQSEKVEELTMDQVCKELGREVKIKKSA